jgi:hypothetical protein
VRAVNFDVVFSKFDRGLLVRLEARVPSCLPLLLIEFSAKNGQGQAPTFRHTRIAKLGESGN